MGWKLVWSCAQSMTLEDHEEKKEQVWSQPFWKPFYMFYSCYRSNAEAALPASVLDRESSAGKQKNKPVMVLAASYNFLVGPTELSLEVLLNSKNTILPIVVLY